MKELFSKIFGRAKEHPKPAPEADSVDSYPCCSEIVHVFYRGVSDDRLYAAHDRKWQETKFFRPNGLRIFCSVCRKRIA